MVEFVSYSGEDRGYDLKTRKKVRSHAMRDFRKRQQMEKNIKCTTLQSSPSNIQVDRQFPKTSPYDPELRPSTPGLASAPGTSDGETPSQSSTGVDRMLDLCKSYYQWLQPDIDAAEVHRLIRSTWEQSESTMCLMACCLASIAQLEAVEQPSGTRRNDASAVKSPVLRELNECMTSQKAGTDDTIRTLACLVSFELARGSCDASNYLHDLSTIIKARGGMKNLTPGLNVPLAEAIESIDLSHALMFDLHPLITQCQRCPCCRQATPERQHTTHTELFTFLASFLEDELITEGMQDNSGPSQNTKLSQLAQVVSAASAAVHSLGTDCCTDSDAATGTSFSSGSQANASEWFREALDRFGQMSIHEGNSVTDDTEGPKPLIRACHLNLLLFYRLAVEKIPYRHSSNQQYVQMLCDAVHQVSVTTWKTLPYFSVWILATGLAAAASQSSRGLFSAHFVRCYSRFNESQRQSVKYFVMNFLKLKTALEQPPGPKLAPLGEHDIGVPLSDFELRVSSTVAGAEAGTHANHVPSSPANGTNSGEICESVAPLPPKHSTQVAENLPSSGTGQATESLFLNNGVQFGCLHVDPFLEIPFAVNDVLERAVSDWPDDWDI